MAAAQKDIDFESEFELLKDQEVVFTAAKHKQDIAESPSTRDFRQGAESIGRRVFLFLQGSL